MSSEKFSARKFGQVYLKDEATAEYEVGLLELKAEESVLEIGPGNGEITRFLLQKGSNVTAVESDPLSVEFLKERFSDDINTGKLNLVHGSILEFPRGTYSAIIGNIPYNITSEILFLLNGFDFGRAVIMIQKEVADRAVAQPGNGDYSRLSVNCNLRYGVRRMRDVPAEFFHPVPGVDSSILYLTKKDAFRPSDLLEIDKVLVRAFSMRRKKMRNIFRNCPARFRELRPENLTPEDFVELWRESA